MTDDNTFTPFEVKYNGQTLFTNHDVFDIFAYTYSSYKCIVSTVYQATTAFFLNLWTAYTNETTPQLYRQLQAMSAEYNPINNYDMTERAADARKIGKTTDTVTPSGGTETETENKVFGLNSGATGEDSDTHKTTVKPLQGTKTETEHTATNDQTATVDNDTVTGNDVTEHILTRSGNIGVTTSAQMVTQEYELRKISILKDYVRMFAARYLFSIGGDE